MVRVEGETSNSLLEVLEEWDKVFKAEKITSSDLGVPKP